MKINLNKFKGTILSLLAAMVGSIPWIILNYFGWLASIAGYLIGFCAYKGYVKGNGKFDRYGKFVLALVIIFTIPLAEIINTSIVFLQAEYSLLESIVYSPLFIIEYLGDYIPSIVIGYFMAGLGTYRFFLDKENS